MIKTAQQVEELASGNLPRLLLKYSWPALVAMCLNALYAVVDRFYIGQGCGEAAMAGLQLAMPVMMIFVTFGVFIGAGHATLLSIRLGENDRVGCERILGELVAFKVLFSLILPPLIFFNLDTVLNWCGGARVSAEALDCARTYLRIVIFSQVFSHIAFGLSGAMRSEGSAIRSMVCMIIGFGVNMLLDPLFIFTFGMGVAGAAWATNIAMVLSCLYAFSHYWFGHSIIALRLRRCVFYPAILWKTSCLGFSPFIQNLLSTLIIISLTKAFGHWAPNPDAATQQIASLGVFNSMLILCFMPIMGAQQGLQPIYGYNWGARNFKRVREAFILGFWVLTALCVLGCVIQTVPPFPRLMARIFVSADNPALIDLAARDLTIANCMLWCISFNVLATTYFQAIGHPGTAIALSTLRQGLILLPCIWFLPYLMENKLLAVWLALPISDVLCQLATLPPLAHHLRFLTRVRTREEFHMKGEMPC